MEVTEVTVQHGGTEPRRTHGATAVRLVVARSATTCRDGRRQIQSAHVQPAVCICRLPSRQAAFGSPIERPQPFVIFVVKKTPCVSVPPVAPCESVTSVRLRYLSAAVTASSVTAPPRNTRAATLFPTRSPTSRSNSSSGDDSN